jgi:hypothetical protein
LTFGKIKLKSPIDKAQVRVDKAQVREQKANFSKKN